MHGDDASSPNSRQCFLRRDDFVSSYLDILVIGQLVILVELSTVKMALFTAGGTWDVARFTE